MIALKNSLLRELFKYVLRSRYVLTTEISFCHYVKLTCLLLGWFPLSFAQWRYKRTEDLIPFPSLYRRSMKT